MRPRPPKLVNIFPFLFFLLIKRGCFFYSKHVKIIKTKRSRIHFTDYGDLTVFVNREVLIGSTHLKDQTKAVRFDFENAATAQNNYLNVIVEF